MKDNILKIVINAVDSINLLLDEKVPISNGSNCALFGASGLLDSLSLVSLIVAVEEAVEDEFNVSIILADEKAMSQKRSPFATVKTLADYSETLIKREMCNV